jgi:hypothetical protein
VAIMMMLIKKTNKAFIFFSIMIEQCRRLKTMHIDDRHLELQQVEEELNNHSNKRRKEF